MNLTQETADNYARELFRSGTHRVVLCRNGIQFILQRCALVNDKPNNKWRSDRYCMTRAGLLRDWLELGGSSDHRIAELPARVSAFRFEGWHQRAAG